MKIKHDFTQPLLLRDPATEVPPAKEPARREGNGKLRGAIGTAVALAALWAGLHWNDPESWVIGLPTVVAGAAATFLLPAASAPRFSLRAGVRLAAFCAWGVLRGAWDVSLLSLRPGRLAQGMVAVRTRLPDGPPRRLFALLITLLPGTLTVRLEGDRLAVHALDCGPAALRDLAALEARIASCFAVHLDGDHI